MLTGILAAATVASAEVKNWGRGPIELSNQYFFSQFHLDAAPRSTAIVEGYEARFAAAWSNTSVVEDNYTVDVETITVPMQFRAGDGRTDFELSVPIISRGGGSLDKFIESWHDTFSLPRGDRHRLDDNDYSIYGQNEDGSSFYFDDDGIDLGVTTLGVRHLLTPGDAQAAAWTLRAALGLPTAPSEYGHSSVDVLVGILGSKRWGQWIGYGGLSGIVVGDQETSNVEYERFHLEGFAEVEYELLSSTSVLVGLYAGSAPQKGIEGHPDYFIYLDVGLKTDISDRTTIDICLRENPAPGDGTVDVTMLLGLTTSFR